MASMVFTLDEHNPTMEMVRQRIGFSVDKETTFAPDGHGGFRPTDYFYTVRLDLPEGDPRRILGVVGDRYTVIQNGELCDSAEVLAGEGGFVVESAGTLANGKLAWLLGKLPGKLDVKGDQIAKYLLLANSHDGSATLKIGFTPIRVVCWNTLSLALSKSAGRGPDGKTSKDAFVSIRHTAAAADRVQAARYTLGLADKQFGAVQQSFGKLAESKLAPEVASAIIKSIFPDPPKGKNPSRAQNTRGEVIQLYRGRQAGGKSEATLGTAYGLFNAVQDYRQYSYGDAPTSDQRATRLQSTWFGSRAAERQSDYETILAAVDFGDKARLDPADALMSQIAI